MALEILYLQEQPTHGLRHQFLELLELLGVQILIQSVETFPTQQIL